MAKVRRKPIRVLVCTRTGTGGSDGDLVTPGRVRPPCRVSIASAWPFGIRSNGPVAACGSRSGRCVDSASPRSFPAWQRGLSGWLMVTHKGQHHVERRHPQHRANNLRYIADPGDLAARVQSSTRHGGLTLPRENGARRHVGSPDSRGRGDTSA